MKQSFKQVGAQLHKLYKRAYSAWKVSQTGVHFTERLDFLERSFYLELQPALMGQNLVAYDIGAADGVIAGLLAKLSNVSSVHAFEPIPSAFNELTDRMKHYPQVICHNVALGETNGLTDIHVIDGTRDSSSLLEMAQAHKYERPGVSYKSHLEKVTLIRLDDYVREKNLPQPNVVKIDVQGYEDRVLRGGVVTIQQTEYCILEISFMQLYENSPLFDDIYSQMRELGFTLIGVLGDRGGVSGRQLQMDGIFENDRLKEQITLTKPD